MSNLSVTDFGDGRFEVGGMVVFAANADDARAQYDEAFSRDIPQHLVKNLAVIEKSARIEQHIYALYPQKKQAQDDKWSLSYTAKLKAAGVLDLEATVVHIIYSISQGQALDKLIAEAVDKWPSAVFGHVSGSTKAERKAYATHMLAKLVKIGVRTEWAEACIRVGKAAIAAGTEPDFPPFLKM